MRRFTPWWLAVACIILPALAHVADAQDGAGAVATVSGFDRLPVSLERIRQQLEVAPPSPSSSPLRLNVRIDVYGRAPRFRLFDETFDVARGPVPFAAPTHAEMLALVTPIEFRAPAVPLLPLSALLNWLSK